MTLPRWLAAAAVPALLTAGVLAAPGASAAPAPAYQNSAYQNSACLVTTVPLYSTAMWKAADGTSPEANVGIANWGANTQNSGAGGPGTSKDSPRAARIITARNDGTTILGYIATNYGTSATGYTETNIEKQMTQWFAWYGVTTFFLDEAPTATTHEPYYAALKTWAAAHIGSSAQEWLNMGAYPAASSWMNDANTIMDWEAGSAPTAPPAWVGNYPASRFAMIMNAVPDSASDIAAAVTDIENAHAGAAFVTSDVNYQTLPNWSYWTTFAGDAAGSACT
jgi:hypothetical protein